MTPFEIEIMLHYYYRPRYFRDGDFSAPASRSALESFCENGLLREAPVNAGALYEITERGRVYVEALKSVPLPIQVWIMPTADRA